MRESNRQGARIPKNQPQSRRLQNDSESDDENAVKFVQETKTRSRKKETRKCIKLTEYDGTTPWPLFYRLFENCSKFNRWDEDERVMHLQVALQGTAQQVLWTDGRVEWTCEELLNELSKRFSPESQVDQYRAMLFSRKRNRGESIENLGQDIARIAAQAFLGPKDQTKEILAIDAFIKAIGNADLGFHMKRTASVKTLADAICYASQYEAAYSTRSDNDEPVYFETQRERKGKNKVAASGDKVEQSAVNDKMKEMEARVQKLENDKQDLCLQLIESKRRQENADKFKTQSNRGGSNYRGGYNSYGRGRGQYRGNDVRGGSVGILCFNCGLAGHISRNCIKPRRGDDYGQTKTQSQSQQETRTTTVDETSTKTAASLKPYSDWTRPALLEVKMNGATRFCLIDSGCGQTMVPPNCVNGMRIKKSKQEIFNASNEPMKILGTTNLRIRLDGRVMDINAVVAADCSEPMLGYDWLEKYAVIVLAHEGVVSVGGIKYQLLPRSSNPEACRVMANETRTIPARSAVIMGSSFRVCRTYERQPQSTVEDWMIEPAEVTKGVYVGREANMPIDIVSGVPEEFRDAYNSANEYVANLQNRMRQVYEKTRTTLQVAAERSKKYYDVSVKSNSYNVGDWVLYYLPKATVGRSIKFEKLFSGPFLIVRKYNDVTYGIQASQRAQVKIVHVDKLKMWFGEKPSSWIQKNADNDMSDVLNLELFENATKVEKNAARGGKRGQQENSVSSAVNENHDTRSADVRSDNTCRPCTVRLSPLPAHAASRSSETSDMERGGQHESLSSLAYKPPAAGNAASERRMQVPTPRSTGKTRSRAKRGQSRVCAVYNTRFQVEKSLKIFQSHEAERIMARTKNTVRKVRDGENAVRKESRDAVKICCCPFKDCKKKTLYARLSNLNNHARVHHGGTYVKRPDGSLYLLAAPAELVEEWKANACRKNRKDWAGKVAKKTQSPTRSAVNESAAEKSERVRAKGKTPMPKNIKTPEFVPESDSSSETQSTSSYEDADTDVQDELEEDADTTVDTAEQSTMVVVQEVADAENVLSTAVTTESDAVMDAESTTVAVRETATNVNENADSQDGELNAAIASISKDADILSAAMNINNVCVDINDNEVVVGENADNVNSIRTADEILRDQSQSQPVPYRVKEVELRSSSVQDAVIKLKNAVPGTSTVADEETSESTDNPQSKKRTATGVPTVRKRVQHIAALPQPEPIKRSSSTETTAYVVRKKVKVAEPIVMQIPRSIPMFHDRVIEIGKWVIGHLDDWHKVDRSRDVMHFSGLSQKDAYNILFMFAESFRAHAVVACRVMDLEELKKSRVPAAVIVPMLDIKHAVPARVDILSRWGAAGLKIAELEYIAQAVSNKIPPFSLQDIKFAAENAVGGIESAVMTEIVQVACTAQQIAARHLNAYKGDRGNFKSQSDGVSINAEYIEYWDVQSAWVKATMNPATTVVVPLVY